MCPWCELPDHTGGCDREQLKHVIKVLRMEKQAGAKLPGQDVIWVQSLVSHRNQKPRIDLQVGEIHTQMDTSAAIDVAKNILEASYGAYADAFIVNFLQEKVGIDLNSAAMIMQEFRDYRAQLEAEFKKDQDGLDT